MALKRAKIYARKRANLGDVVPRTAPFSIQIDVCSACNMKCNFCFHSDTGAVRRSGVRFGLMDFEIFKKIIDDMKAAWGGAKSVSGKKAQAV